MPDVECCSSVSIARTSIDIGYRQVRWVSDTRRRRVRSCSPFVLVRLDALFWTPRFHTAAMETRDVLLLGRSGGSCPVSGSFFLVLVVDLVLFLVVDLVMFRGKYKVASQRLNRDCAFYRPLDQFGCLSSFLATCIIQFMTRIHVAETNLGKEYLLPFWYM